MKIRQVKPKDLLKVLIKFGFVVKRKKGSHVFLELQTLQDRRFTSISLHNEPLPKGTLKGILKQTQISEDELIELL